MGQPTLSALPKMFRGRQRLALDSKGRLQLPSKFRTGTLVEETGRVVVTIDRAPCLLIYPLPEWEIVEHKLARLSSVSETARQWKRFLLGNAEDCEIDAQARILLPAELRVFALLEKQVMLVGQGNKLELWNAPLWDGQNAAWLAQSSSLAASLPELAALDF